MSNETYLLTMSRIAEVHAKINESAGLMLKGETMKDNKRLWHGKRKDNGEWVEGSPFGEFMICGMSLVRGDDEVPMSEYPEFDYVEIDPSTLGECTCVPDKKNTLIFEGDIVEYKGERYVIKYLEKYMRFSPVKPGTVFAIFDYTQSEIIGNIYDTPKLMEG